MLKLTVEKFLKIIFADMQRARYLIMMAGGSGTRMGAPVPKQFMLLGGKPVLMLTMERFVSAVDGLKVITVLPSGYIQSWKDLCYEYNFHLPQTIVEGGLTRFHSVRNGLAKVPDGALVAVHDGVRPFVSDKLISSLFRMAGTCPAVVPAVPCVDTLRPIARRPDGSGLMRVDDPPVDRSRVFAVQTPQVFWSEILKEAYTHPFDTSFTDDASVAEKAGTDVTYVEGEKFNIKLTSPDDMKMAEALRSILGY